MYYDVAIGKIDLLDVKLFLTEKTEAEPPKRTLDGLLSKNLKELPFDTGGDFLVIDNNLKNINYKLASCCNPVFGDNIFGFVSIREGIKIHRDRCPNAPQMKERFPYRIIKARWKGQNTSSRNSSFLATLYISGTSEIGIVPEISHIIAKDSGTQMRSINIESDKGNFEGVLKLFVYNLEHLEFLIQQIRKVNGVTSVTRGER